MAATAKHFVGDGGTVNGIDENNTVTSFKSLVNIHMVSYFDAISKGVSTIMTSYSSWNGQKMHDNRFLISHVLKKQLGFKVQNHSLPGIDMLYTKRLMRTRLRSYIFPNAICTQH